MSQPPFLTREFELESSGGDGTQKIELVVFLPTHDSADDTYVCEFRFRGWNERKRAAYGVDALQAVQLALQMAAALLYTSREYQEGRLTWLGEKALGLPVSEDQD